MRHSIAFQISTNSFHNSLLYLFPMSKYSLSWALHLLWILWNVTLHLLTEIWYAIMNFSNVTVCWVLPHSPLLSVCICSLYPDAKMFYLFVYYTSAGSWDYLYRFKIFKFLAFRKGHLLSFSVSSETSHSCGTRRMLSFNLSIFCLTKQQLVPLVKNK